MNRRPGPLECGGKRKRDTAFATRVRAATPVRMPHLFPPEIPSKGGVALTLPAALQGAQRASMRPHNSGSWYYFGSVAGGGTGAEAGAPGALEGGSGTTGWSPENGACPSVLMTGFTASPFTLKVNGCD